MAADIRDKENTPLPDDDDDDEVFFGPITVVEENAKLRLIATAKSCDPVLRRPVLRLLNANFIRDCLASSSKLPVCSRTPPSHDKVIGLSLLSFKSG